GESLSEAWTRFKGLPQKVPHNGIDLWLQVQIFYYHVNPATRRTIDQAAGGKLHEKNAEESLALLEDLALNDNKSWNDLRDFAKPVKAIYLPQDVLSTSDRRHIEHENQVQHLMEAHLALNLPIQVKKSLLHVRFVVVLMTLKIAWKIPSKLLLSTHTRIETKRETCGARTPYYAKKDFTDYHLPNKKEIARDNELNPFNDVLVFKRMVEFLGVIPINLKGNMWESEKLIENRIDWNKLPKGGDRACHAKIILIDPDEEKFSKTFQSVPTTRKLPKKENLSEIIDLDHFHNS
ncbi:hypothetical protein Tco_1427017, partial [Tanacetum coccineum]